MENIKTEKGFNKDKGYRIVRLVNGERLIAKMSGRTSSKKLILERPMTIRGMVNSNPIIGMTKEYLILTDWMEYCVDNEARISENYVLTISMPDDFLIEAYDAQKEYMDTGNAGPNLEDIDKIGNMTLKDLLENPDFNEDNIERFDQDSLKDFLGEFFSSIMGSAAERMEEEWSDDDLDKDRDDFGNNFDDWSPHPEDYM